VVLGSGLGFKAAGLRFSLSFALRRGCDCTEAGHKHTCIRDLSKL
jgi:hypothetical protein